ncbi:MAG: phosphonate metabolism protein PhnM [Desulfobacterales bacterium RIFOXYA12_FULL_46_15]|nr:MAG: phosphonate metabolism protein PhnM [Desulfobacterales bacterium RIFOXYA12_FULL_46_15]
MKTVITGGPLFDGIRLHENGSVLFENGRITQVCEGKDIPHAGNIIDTCGNLIMPGLVDLHSDSLERSIEKRKGVFFDIEFAILNLDRQLAACGITTFCHAVSFADNELGLRSPKEAENCLKKIKAFQESGQALIRHQTHVRYEVGSEQSFDIILNLVKTGLVDMVSVMDHTPGQGQFKSMGSYLKFHSEEYDLSSGEILEKAKEKQENNNRAWDMVKILTGAVAARGIPMLSHDDDTRDRIGLIKAMGIRACEFPVTLEAARAAAKEDLMLFMGAPNLIRDTSTNGNLKASEVLREGLCTGLVSDYYPESLFQAAFVAAQKISGLEQALHKVTSGPGSFLNTPDKPGFLVPGAGADILIVNRDHRWVHITDAFVKGRTVFHIQSRENLK